MAPEFVFRMHAYDGIGPLQDNAKPNVEDNV